MNSHQGIGIHFTPYGKASFKHSGTVPTAGYRYKSPAGTLWNADHIESNHVHMWTVNAWGATHREVVHLADFTKDWKELDPPYQPF